MDQFHVADKYQVLVMKKNILDRMKQFQQKKYFNLETLETILQITGITLS